VGRPIFPAGRVKHRIKRQDQQLAALAKADAEAALGEESQSSRRRPDPDLAAA
jgi:hypothetical protein